MATPFIVERVASKSPSRMGYRFDGGRCVMALKATRVDTSTGFWADILEYVLGSTEVTATNGGKVKRVLPISAPDAPNMVADQIEEIQGIGRPVKGVVAGAVAAVPSLPACALYPAYEMTVSFLPMEFNYAKDEDVKTKTGTWVPFDGSAATTFKYVTEYDRYTMWTIEDGFEIVQTQFGQRSFVTSDGLDPGGRAFPGSVSDRIPRPVVRFGWYKIPYRYYASANSYIRKFKGCVNQDTFLTWKPGQLLYLDAKVKRYLPGLPTYILDDQNIFKSHLGALCDVEFIWELREWDTERPPTPANLNFVPAGHNSERNFMFPGKAFYCVGKGFPLSDAAQWRPKYLSQPFLRLFTDPDQNPE